MSETWDMYGRLGAIDKTVALGLRRRLGPSLVHIGHAGHLRNALHHASLDRPRSPIAPTRTLRATWAGCSDRANYSQHCQFFFCKQKNRYCGEGYRPRIMCSGHMSEVAHRITALPAAASPTAEASSAQATSTCRLPKTTSTTPTRKTLPATHPLTSAESLHPSLAPPGPPEKGIKAAAVPSPSGRPGKASGIRVMLQHHMLDTPPTASSPLRLGAAAAVLHGRLLRPAGPRVLLLIKRLVASHLRPCMSKSSFAHCARHEQPVAIFAHAYPRVHNAFAVPVGQLRSD
ncbi:hypothetical protein COCCADRAFT_36464 [Bipolaris zeicola 26-R-13]|uniref:Uncharacterized protein n=1 Tax=Cochliobolus carbonum (strain 26-R-13) TaxID=930089 RepID=W6Y8B2_COCC2|nr:uncharacterized protein COCCADRAFT_36464 [Bipolaris zeicola 26-R-13]EUC33710.1 hypothetical protein COCCADRAFT_36464 [Bipolaris zeicola 26-R-13]